MMKFLIISVTKHMLQNRVSDIIMHVTLNTINGVPLLCCKDLTKGRKHTKWIHVMKKWK
jgi:hypothetical protein